MDEVRRLGGRFIRDCDALEEVHIPDTVSTMNYGAFMGCDKLSSANYPARWVTCTGNVSMTKNSPFVSCPKLTSVTVPDGVTAIPAYAFIGVSMEWVYVPSSVISIGKGAFDRTPEGFEIRCKSGSTAMGYAIENNIQYSIV